jgi:hypothetical protein
MVIPCHKQVRSGGVCDNLRPNVLSDKPLALLLNQSSQILINSLHRHWRLISQTAVGSPAQIKS